MSRRPPGRVLRRLGRAVFGDRLGLVLWLGLLAFFVVFWRLELAITDSNVYANMLLSMAEGNLAVTELRFPLDTLASGRVQQGLGVRNGVYYGRNYGQVALAVPVLWALRALSSLADVRLLLAGGWALCVLAGIHQLGVVLDVPRRGRLAGAAVGGGTFLASLSVATDVDPRLLPVIALQLVNIAAAAGVGVFVYRLASRFHGRRVGFAAGVATGLATPIAFWATFPKRHVLVALLVVAGILSFARSRDRERGWRLARGGAYAAFGLVAWIHAFEGFVLVAALAAADFATAEGTDRRTAAIVALCLFLALAPTLGTNAAVTGDPVKPPRLLDGGGDVESDLVSAGDERVSHGGESSNDEGSIDGSADGSVHGSGSTDESVDGSADGSASRDGGPGGSGSPPEGDGGGLPDVAGWLVGSFIGLLPASVRSALGVALDLTTGGVTTLDEPDRLRHIFLRSGNYEQFLPWEPPYQPYELSVLESMPLLAALIGLPVAGVRRAHRRVTGERRGSVAATTPGKTDVLVGTIAVAFTVVYLSRLPLQGQLTVRYLFVLYPLGVYAIARSGPVRDAVQAAPRQLLAWSAIGLAGTLLAGPVVSSGLGLARAEAVQAHAIVHLGLAVLLGAVVIGRLVAPDRYRPAWLAGALGVVAGSTTAYYVLAALAYFSATFALDATRILAEWVSIL
jgi:hypothetical protein